MTSPTSQEIEAREKSPVLTEDTRPGLVFRPDVDILEHADAYVILADMPGTREDDVDVRLDQGVLTLDARPRMRQRHRRRARACRIEDSCTGSDRGSQRRRCASCSSQPSVSSSA